MISIKIILLLLIVQEMFNKFWLRSEFKELKYLCGSDFHKLQELRYASALQKKIENERN